MTVSFFFRRLHLIKPGGVQRENGILQQRWSPAVPCTMLHVFISSRASLHLSFILRLRLHSAHIAAQLFVVSALLHLNFSFIYQHCLSRLELITRFISDQLLFVPALSLRLHRRWRKITSCPSSHVGVPTVIMGRHTRIDNDSRRGPNKQNNR